MSSIEEKSSEFSVLSPERDGTATRWTPGPWRTFMGPTKGQIWIEHGPASLVLTEVAPRGSYKETAANAHLIAAAPDLYTTLHEALNVVNWDQDDPENACYCEPEAQCFPCRIRKVLAAARGEKP